MPKKMSKKKSKSKSNIVSQAKNMMSMLPDVTNLLSEAISSETEDGNEVKKMMKGVMSTKVKGKKPMMSLSGITNVLSDAKSLLNKVSKKAIKEIDDVSELCKKIKQKIKSTKCDGSFKMQNKKYTVTCDKNKKTGVLVDGKKLLCS